MKTKILIVLLTILFISSLIYAQTQIKGGEIQRGTPQIQRGTQISDEPVIREFSLNPNFGYKVKVEKLPLVGELSLLQEELLLPALQLPRLLVMAQQ